MQLQGCNLAGIIMDMWDVVKTGWDSKKGEAILCISNGNAGSPPCLRAGKELVRIRGWTNGRDIMVEKGKPNPTWSWVW